MSLLQQVRTGAPFPNSSDSIQDRDYRQAVAILEAEREPKREAVIKQTAPPQTLDPSIQGKLQHTLARLKEIARTGTADNSSLILIEGTLILLKQKVHSDSPESDAKNEFEATKTLLKDLAHSQTPKSTSLHAIQAALTLLRQRIRPGIPESLAIDEIQATLSLLKQATLLDTEPPAKPNEHIATPTLSQLQNEIARDQNSAVFRNRMNNSVAAVSLVAGGGLGSDALADELYRHQETKRSLASTEATVQRLSKELDKVNSYIEDFRADRAYLREQVDERDETIRDREAEVRTQQTRISELQATLAPQTARLETLEAELEAERTGRQAALESVEQKNAELERNAKQIHDLEKLAEEDAILLAEKDEELALLQSQLREANKDITRRDRKLRSAASEKERLEYTIADADGHLKETASVVGETVLTLNSELDRLMAAIMSIRKAAEPPAARQKRQRA